MFNLSIFAKDLSEKVEKVTEIRLKSDDIKFMPYAIDALKYFSKLKIPKELLE